MEDANVEILLRQLAQALGANRKPIFLVAPRFRQAKRQFLHNNNITYIDSTGEVFIEKLYVDIKENIIKDYEDQKVSLKTLQQFLAENNLKFDTTFDGKRKFLTKLSAINGPLKANIQMKFGDKVPSKYELVDLLQGISINPITIGATDLEDFKFSSRSINLIGSLKDYRITFSRSPRKEGDWDICFDNGFEVSNFQYKIFSTADRAIVNCTYKNSVFEILIPYDNPEANSNFSYKRVANFEKVSDALNTLMLLKYLYSGNSFSVFTHENKKFHRMPTATMGDIDLTILERHLEFYTLLQQVEKLYKINFSDIPEPNNDTYFNARLAIETVNQRTIIVEGTDSLGFDITKAESPLELIQKLQEPGVVLEVIENERESIEILGQQIDLGYKATIYDDLEVINLSKIQSGEETNAVVRSKSGRVKILYKKEYHET